MVPLGLSHALSIKVAHALGAGQPKRARQIAITGFKLVWMLAETISLAKLALHEEIPRWFSDDRATQAIAANLFLFAALLGAIDCLQIAASGALRGYKDTRIPLLMQIIAFWVIAFPISYTLGLTDLWGGAIGVYGFWVGMIVAVVIASVLLLSRWNLLSKRFIASAQ
jgi:MATE family multidrug resistance protein